LIGQQPFWKPIQAGLIGAMAAEVARHIGAGNVVVTDVNDYRLGASRTVNVG
jgi:threonine 3-dehydrogenase